MAAGGSTKVIIVSFVANLGIAIAKGFAAAITGSGAMLAESIHSAADCTNQLMLLLGAKQATKPPTKSHPLGRGRAAYFWSFLVALMIFFGGGVFAIQEGIHKLSEPGTVESPMIAFVVLGFSILLEGYACYQVVKALNAKRGDIPFFKYLGLSKDADLVVLVAEDSAAMLGLVTAAAALGLAVATGNVIYDALGTIAIGVILCLVAVWLAREVKSLLEGEAADPAVAEAFREHAKAHELVTEVLNVITVQQGPGQVLVAAKIRLAKDLGGKRAAVIINEVETSVKKDCPDVMWFFVEPDIEV